MLAIRAGDVVVVKLVFVDEGFLKIVAFFFDDFALEFAVSSEAVVVFVDC